ncbi:MAG: exodeoxyribonuclease VII large subunit [Prevotellaceae bacterium]|jgi:exodeoxyribonuclease VII large subunit|nr:exodeoxyribonuclease VII large subunit [Prevotellaceae bacterium]
MVTNINSISLSELLNAVRDTIRINFDDLLWVRAQIGELHENNGHAFLELVENAENTDTLLAKTRANCWSSTYRMLKPYFEEHSGQTLRAGIAVMVAVTVEFHAVYGISLNIRDIEPAFTVGDLAIRRLQVIQRLQNEGIAEMNKLLEFPQRPQRLAVISSATAAGFGDFKHQLETNGKNFKFYVALFQSVMQGDTSAASIIESLEKIFAHVELFDAVVIIRGGGATTDLASFDSYDLALNIAQFPLPVIAGIGHLRDSTIVDMVANQSVKTPTAAAEFVIDKMQTAENALFNKIENIMNLAQNIIAYKRNRVEQIRWNIKHLIKSVSESRNFELTRQQIMLENAARNIIASQKNKLDIYEKVIQTQSPFYLLKKGYSLTTFNGECLFSAKQIQKGDIIKTYLSDGTVESKIVNSEQ